MTLSCSGFAPIFPDTCYHLTHYWPAAVHEQGFNSAWIEMQLAHVDKNSIRGTYNHAHYLDGRRKMMQWYADYIDSLMGKTHK
ncbi:hypothetical protein BZL70_05060 [Escherichia coli]|nr:hypothetical protein BZL70_05060 [Escherichia coli]